MTNPFLDPAWFAALADRLPGRSAGAPVAFETVTGDGAAVRHRLLGQQMRHQIELLGEQSVVIGEVEAEQGKRLGK